MAARKRKAARRRPAGRARSKKAARRSRGARRGWKIAALLVVVSGFAGGFVMGRHLVRLDRVVTERFEGRLFRVPSRVLSAPTILYPGLDWKQIGLRDGLDRLGYRPGGGDPLPVGRYRWGEGTVLLHRRPFEHPTRAEPARYVQIRLEGAEIGGVRDLQSGRELGAFFLEPELVGAYHGPDREQRDLVQLGDLPQHLVDAVIAVEDQRFLDHPGIDVRRILGALWVNVRSGGIRQGGSTLTQQLVKNFFLTPERSYERKIQEALMAILVEARYDKSSILEAYLNEIYLGQRGPTAIHGMGEASRFYFGKQPRHLTLPESALLAGIIQSPNGLAPRRHAEAATARRNLVLRLMQDQGRIEPAERAAAEAEPLRVSSTASEPGEARYFLEALRRQLPDFYGQETLATEGLVIYSTLDLRLQMTAARAVREGLEALEERYPKLASDGAVRVQACLVALRPQTGEVLALVGGRDYGQSQFNRCVQAKRQAGSAFKPFVVAAALEPVPGGPTVTLASRLLDAPLEVSTPGGPWRPTNFDDEYRGEVSVRHALEKSLNVPMARLAQDVGTDRIVSMAQRLGIESALPRVPSLALGVAEVTPLEMARAYATLANGGIRPQIRTFEDVVGSDRRAAERLPIAFERVLDAGTAYLVTSLLEGVVDRGTARGVRSAGITGPVAGKTGTTNEERDAWFVSFTPELVVAVWVGFDRPRSLGIPSSRAAIPLFVRFFEDARGGRARGSFRPPGDVEQRMVDPESGALALVGCPARAPEWFLRGTEPATVCPNWANRREPEARTARRAPGVPEAERDAREPGVFEQFLDEWFGRR